MRRNLPVWLKMFIDQEKDYKRIKEVSQQKIFPVSRAKKALRTVRVNDLKSYMRYTNNSEELIASRTDALASKEKGKKQEQRVQDVLENKKVIL